MTRHIKAAFFLLMVLAIGGVWRIADAQSGRRGAAQPQPAATPVPNSPDMPDAPTRGTGTPVWVAFAETREAPEGEVRPKPSQPLAERVAEWLFQEGGLKVARLPKALTANDAQELARKQTVGYVVWLELGESHYIPKNARCDDRCNPKCLRDIARFQGHYYVFAAGSGAPQLDSLVEAIFDPYLFNPATCPPSRERSRGRREAPTNAPICPNASPTELTPDSLECLSRKIGVTASREIKGENKL